MIGLVALPLLLACNDEGDPFAPPPSEPRLEITPSNAAIDVGQTIRLRARLWNAEGEVLDADYAVAWSSSDPEVLHVTQTGFATGMAQGTATISAAGLALSDWTRVAVRQAGEGGGGIGDGNKYEPEDDREDKEDRWYVEF
jgi:hypothetical protein